ncbi:MAG: FHA domain-containing protein [Finegoldia sp.]|nr:FHA domain-containing protein [Finegoldia sp.]
MKYIVDLLDAFFSIQITAQMSVYDLTSIVLKYIFVIIIYYFIFNIIRMIYLDIKQTNNMNYTSDTYLKLINRKENLPFKVQEHYYIGSSTGIGRAENNEIVLNDRFISKKHARIFKNKGQYYIEDLKSANGTYVNGDRLISTKKLNNKDLLDIGQVEFMFINGDNNGNK